MVRRGVLRWSLLAALVGGGVAVVVVAALWGGTPLRELPLIVTSMVVGGFLPPSVTAIYRRGEPVPRRRPAEPFRATGLSECVEFVSEPRRSEGGLKLFTGLAGPFLGGTGTAICCSGSLPCRKRPRH